MHPRSADMHAALTAEPHAPPRNFLGGRSAHARDLAGRHAASLQLGLKLSVSCHKRVFIRT
eukprot:213596-Prymnesium_polylepis.1